MIEVAPSAFWHGYEKAFSDRGYTWSRTILLLRLTRTALRKPKRNTELIKKTQGKGDSEKVIFEVAA